MDINMKFATPDQMRDSDFAESFVEIHTTSGKIFCANEQDPRSIVPDDAEHKPPYMKIINALSQFNQLQPPMMKILVYTDRGGLQEILVHTSTIALAVPREITPAVHVPNPDAIED